MNVMHGTVNGRAIAISGLVAGLAIAYFAFFYPMVQAVNWQLGRVSDLQASIGRYQSLESYRPALQASLGQLERQSSASQFFLQSAKASTGAAEIEQKLKAVVSRHGGTISSTQALPEILSNGKRAVAVRVRLRSHVPQLTGVLHNLESLPVALFIQDLTIQARNSRSRSSTQRQWRDLDVEFELVGYLSESEQP